MFRPLLLTATLGLATLLNPLTAPPAHADTLSVTLTPRTDDQANLLRLGLGLYALREGMRGSGEVRQTGFGNAAALLQSGPGNWGLIRQRGTGHSASLAQTGGNNAHAILQSGSGAVAHVAQTGGQLGLTLQYGF